MATDWKKRIKALIPFGVFFILALPLLFRSFGNADELWNYNFAIQIRNGKLPYADFNMIQTPLSACVSALFLFVFGNSLLSYRLAGVVLIALTFALLHMICKRVTRSGLIAWVACAFSYVLIYHIWMFHYNSLNLVMVLLMIALETGEDSRRARYFKAVLYGVTPLIKQTTGGLLLLWFLGSTFWRTMRNQTERKDAFCAMGVSLLPSICFAGYLFLSGTFRDFWEYAIQGMATFTHRTYLWEYVVSFFGGFLVAGFILVSLMLSVMVICRKKNENRALHLRILIIALIAGVVAYPLTDHEHMMIAMIPYLICMLMCFRYRQYTEKEQYACIFVVCTVLLASSLAAVDGISKQETSCLNHYRGVPMETGMEQTISMVNDFITEHEEKGRRVIIADESAVAYMIPLDRYTKNFDMLLVGNLGTGSVEELLTDEEAIYLVLRDEDKLGYQAHNELIAYIKNNYCKVGEVAGFDAYEKQNESR